MKDESESPVVRRMVVKPMLRGSIDEGMRKWKWSRLAGPWGDRLLGLIPLTYPLSIWCVLFCRWAVTPNCSVSNGNLSASVQVCAVKAIIGHQKY